MASTLLSFPLVSSYVSPKVNEKRPSFICQGLSNCLSLSESTTTVVLSVSLFILAIPKKHKANNIEKVMTKGGPQSVVLSLTFNQRLTILYCIQRLLTPVRGSLYTFFWRLPFIAISLLIPLDLN